MTVALFCGCGSVAQVQPIASKILAENLNGESNSGDLASQKPPVAQQRSWIDPSANRSLIYVSTAEGRVYIYTYPRGSLVGTLSGFSEPTGECVNNKDDIWIADAGNEELWEYAHGAKSPLRLPLFDPGERPEGCAIDPHGGNLAVANDFTTSGGPGSVSIYRKASGNPQVVPAFYNTYSLTYDDHGNIFVDGQNAGGKFAFGEIVKGGNSVNSIELHRVKILFCGGVHWDGTYVDVGDAASATIYRTSGTKVVQAIPLEDVSNEVPDFFVENRRLIVTNHSFPSSVNFYMYPMGGPPLSSIQLPGSQTSPFGVVVSN
ncbi:MAG TPA: hypothetical protein VFE16_01230 [Candidatus Cybelea sp.]|nr:hypothetical protein [Candidatus Cybelea sp.]